MHDRALKRHAVPAVAVDLQRTELEATQRQLARAASGVHVAVR